MLCQKKITSSIIDDALVDYSETIQNNDDHLENGDQQTGQLIYHSTHFNIVQNNLNYKNTLSTTLIIYADTLKTFKNK